MTREDLDRDGERGFDYLTFALVSSKAHLEGVGLRVADSHTANHPEGDFTPLETIRRLLVVIGKRSHSGFEGEAFNPETRRCGLSAKELNEFLSFYLIPSEYDVILPTSTQTIFDAPPEMAFRNFIYTEDDDDLAFLPKEPSPGFGESPKAGMFVVHPGSVAARIKERKCNTRGGSSRPSMKRKLASGSSSSRDAVVDSAVNRRASTMAEFDQNPTVLALREKISSMTVDVKEHKGNLDRMMLESQKWAGYQVTLSTLKSKVNSLEADKARLEDVEASLRKEVEELKQPWSWCIVAAMKEPFDLSKAKGYRSSYQKDHTQASNDFDTAMFLWLDEFIADAIAPIETLF
ncbi:hypothetical protein Tco_0641556 [Tanacetum coccineum]